MIYSTFKRVESSYNYAQLKMKDVFDDAETYIKDVIRESGTLELTVNNKPTIIALKGKQFDKDEHVVLYQNSAKPKKLIEFGVEEVCGICKEIHSMHIVEEYGEEKEQEEEGHEPA